MYGNSNDSKATSNPCNDDGTTSPLGGGCRQCHNPKARRQSENSIQEHQDINAPLHIKENPVALDKLFPNGAVTNDQGHPQVLLSGSITVQSMLGCAWHDCDIDLFVTYQQASQTRQSLLYDALMDPWVGVTKCMCVAHVM